LLVAVTALLIAAGVWALARQGGTQSGMPAAGGGGGRVLQVVAAENFWGSLAAQIGGTHVHVLSIVSDPNADPHEYESNASDARAVAQADYVIENGAGYDSWMGKLLAAGANPHRRMLDVASFLGITQGDNPHVWYDPAYVNEVSAKIEADLAALDPADAGYFAAQYAALKVRLAGYQDRIGAIKAQFAGTQVAATEDIFTYLASASGLDLISPPAFTQAVAEGNDPPASSIVQFEDQLKAGTVRMLVYNEQTVTPLTDSIKALAAQQGIPVVGITETIQPPTLSFEEWMNGEIAAMQNALSASQHGR
jgi:zinc/manganese transport system substrate-binding protein